MPAGLQTHLLGSWLPAPPFLNCAVCAVVSFSIVTARCCPPNPQFCSQRRAWLDWLLLTLPGPHYPTPHTPPPHIHRALPYAVTHTPDFPQTLVILPLPHPTGWRSIRLVVTRCLRRTGLRQFSCGHSTRYELIGCWHLSVGSLPFVTVGLPPPAVICLILTAPRTAPHRAVPLGWTVSSLLRSFHKADQLYGLPSHLQRFHGHALNAGPFAGPLFTIAHALTVY